MTELHHRREVNALVRQGVVPALKYDDRMWPCAEHLAGIDPGLLLPA